MIGRLLRSVFLAFKRAHKAMRKERQRQKLLEAANARREPSRAVPRTSRSVGGKSVKVSLMADPQADNLVDQLRAVAEQCTDGGVQIMESAGRTSKPTSMTILNLPQPVRILYGTAFLSATATLNTVVYGFHAYVHPLSNAYSRHWLYFSVTGPNRETLQEEEFQITDEFRWTGQRPLNPMIVKYALREWIKQPDVQAAINAAHKGLKKPEKGL